MFIIVFSGVLSYRVLGALEIDDFDGNLEPELKILTLGKEFLLHCSPDRSIAENIDKCLCEYHQ